MATCPCAAPRAHSSDGEDAITSTALNLMGEPAHLGRFCGSNEYTVTPGVVEFYADALEDHHPRYAEFAPPLLHHSECYKFAGEWYLENLFGNLHAQQDWELFRAHSRRLGGSLPLDHRRSLHPSEAGTTS